MTNSEARKRMTPTTDPCTLDAHVLAVTVRDLTATLERVRRVAERCDPGTSREVLAALMPASNSETGPGIAASPQVDPEPTPSVPGPQIANLDSANWSVGIIAQTVSGEVLLKMTDTQAASLRDSLVWLTEPEGVVVLGQVGEYPSAADAGDVDCDCCEYCWPDPTGWDCDCEGCNRRLALDAATNPTPELASDPDAANGDTGLTEDERALLDEAEGWVMDDGAHRDAAVLQIVAARVAVAMSQSSVQVRLTEDERELARVIRDVAEGDGFTVELYGVKVAKCDTYGQTESERDLAARVAAVTAERDEWADIATDEQVARQHAEAEVASLREQIAAVGALADEWEALKVRADRGRYKHSVGADYAAKRLRAALATTSEEAS